MKAFHAYDIRGIYNKDFNKDDVYKVGYFLPMLLKTKRVLVGRDVRNSSPEVFEYLTRGIMDCGASVYDAGLATTPMIYYTTAKNDFEASVMITASHNDKEYNGLKISRKGAMPVGYDSGLKELERMMKEEEIIVDDEPGQIIEIDAKTTYLEFLRESMVDISGLNVSIDCSNGMAALLIKDILGDTASYLFDELDGNFPNHAPNPLVQKNVEALKQAVIKNKSDLGIIFDGDADRVMFVDEKGSFIPPDLMIALMGKHFLKDVKGAKPKVIHDIRTSKSVTEYVEKLGGETYMWKVGRAYAALKLREIDGLYGGELAGHYYFKDFFYSDSGILAMLIVLKIIKEEKENGKLVSELIDEISNYSNSGEINYTIQQKAEAMNCVKDYFYKNENITDFYDFDGYRMEFKDWWFNIRSSNTEPYLRLLVEAKTEEQLQEKLDLMKELLSPYFK